MFKKKSFDYNSLRTLIKSSENFLNEIRTSTDYTRKLKLALKFDWCLTAAFNRNAVGTQAKF